MAESEREAQPDSAAAAAGSRGLASAVAPEVSVVMPCLNEVETLGRCIEKARAALDENRIEGEIIVADNGSTDGSAELAERLGVRVVLVEEPGYGCALMGGIEAARGKYVVMGDADDSYDFGELPRLVEGLRSGHDLVQGCRLESGGGTVKEGAMPLLHRRWGNPMFSWLARSWFGSPVTDIYCGFRGFRRDWQRSLAQRCTGMEFATEMIVKGSVHNASIAEVPVTLHPDGRDAGGPHLRTFRDGWRTLRFFLLFSPRWLYLVPGLSLIGAGVAGYAVALPELTVLDVTFGAHTLVFASLAIICGYQAILFGIFTKTFAVTEGLVPSDPRLDRLYAVVDLERGLLIAAATLAVGIGLLIAAVVWWASVDFGPLDYADTMRLVIPGSMLTALGFQTVLASFFVSVLGMSVRS